MIQVQRLPKPVVLVKNEESWVEAIRNAQTALERKKAVQKYQHREVKDALIRMFHGKCAYCESIIRHIDYGDIEHYKPKSKFPEDAVVWGNLLIFCKRCNGRECKGDHFPDHSEGGPPINPCDDNPDDYFDFDYDEETQTSQICNKTKRGRTSIDVYGLNRPELLKYRSNQVKRLAAVAKFWAPDSIADSLLKEVCSGASEYAAFARVMYSRLTQNNSLSSYKEL